MADKPPLAMWGRPVGDDPNNSELARPAHGFLAARRADGTAVVPIAVAANDIGVRQLYEYDVSSRVWKESAPREFDLQERFVAFVWKEPVEVYSGLLRKRLLTPNATFRGAFYRWDARSQTYSSSGVFTEDRYPALDQDPAGLRADSDRMVPRSQLGILTDDGELVALNLGYVCNCGYVRRAQPLEGAPHVAWPSHWISGAYESWSYGLRGDDPHGLGRLVRALERVNALTVDAGFVPRPIPAPSEPAAISALVFVRHRAAAEAERTTEAEAALARLLPQDAPRRVWRVVDGVATPQMWANRRPVRDPPPPPLAAPVPPAWFGALSAAASSTLHRAGARLNDPELRALADALERAVERTRSERQRDVSYIFHAVVRAFAEDAFSVPALRKTFFTNLRAQLEGSPAVDLVDLRFDVSPREMPMPRHFW